MRITRELLIKLARDTVQQRVKTDRNLVAAILTGSTLKGDPFIGGATDIDLIYVMVSMPPNPREVVKLNNEVSLDISYHDLTKFEPARKLRTDTTLGYIMYDSMLLYESKKFFEYTQAIVRPGFDDPSTVLNRVRQHSDPARSAWMQMMMGLGTKPADVKKYLDTLYNASNAVALLTGTPLTERRMMTEFPVRAKAAGRPEMSEALLGMLWAFDVQGNDIEELVPFWEVAFRAAASDAGNPAIDLARLGYYKNAIEALIASNPPAATWLLLNSWTDAAIVLPGYSPEVQSWRAAMDKFGFGVEGLDQKVESLDLYLDALEELLDSYAAENGIT